VPHHYFNLRDGVTLVDPAGLDCRDDADAIVRAKVIADGIAVEAPSDAQPRHIAVLNADGQEIFKAPVRRRPAA
jgi:hypothetical protein